MIYMLGFALGFVAEVYARSAEAKAAFLPITPSWTAAYAEQPKLIFNPAVNLSCARARAAHNGRSTTTPLGDSTHNA